MKLAHALAIALTLSSCGRGTTQPAANLEPGSPTEPPTAEAPPAPVTPRTAVLVPGREPDGRFTEVVLDPRGEAALSLDAAGVVLLWPCFADPSACAPWTIPTSEPIWMSLAQAQRGGGWRSPEGSDDNRAEPKQAQRGDGFVIGLIDTANRARVYRVELAEKGSEAKITELFALSPSEPLLELHVLDGGARVLSLGIDHRIRLFDERGEVVSEIDQRSFLPWQLRVVGGVDGPPKLAAVLAQPVRVQPLVLDGDVLKLDGEARPVELDRGINRNDLALSPDGTTVAALRRPGVGRAWTVELIELATDARELIGGRSTSNLRPRMHFATPTKLVFETGATAELGLEVDLAGAVELRSPEDALPDSKLAERLGKREHPTLRLVGTGERKATMEDDTGRRFDATVVNGVRAVPNGDRLIIDRLDDGEHLELHIPRSVILGALDPTGERVAWFGGNTLVVERIGGDELARIDLAIGEPKTLDWIDAERLLITTGMTARVVTLGAEPTVEQLALRDVRVVIGLLRSSAGAPELWYLNRSDALQAVEITAGQLGTQRQPAATELPETACADAHARGLSRFDERSGCERAGDGRLFISSWDHRTTVEVIDPTGAETKQLALPLGGSRELSLSPDNQSLAVLLVRQRDDDARVDNSLLVVLDAATGERLWARALPGWSWRTGIAWSGDSKSLAFWHDGAGMVYAARDGELLHDNQGRFTIDRVQDSRP